MTEAEEIAALKQRIKALEEAVDILLMAHQSKGLREQLLAEARKDDDD